MSVATLPCAWWNFDQRRDINVRHAVAVSRHEHFVLLEILARAENTGAGHGILAGVHTGDTPWFLGLAVKRNPVGCPCLPMSMVISFVNAA